MLSLIQSFEICHPCEDVVGIDGSCLCCKCIACFKCVVCCPVREMNLHMIGYMVSYQTSGTFLWFPGQRVTFENFPDWFSGSFGVRLLQFVGCCSFCFTLPWDSGSCVSTRASSAFHLCIYYSPVAVTHLLYSITGGSEWLIYRTSCIFPFPANPCVIASDKVMLWFGIWRRVLISCWIKNAAL